MCAGRGPGGSKHDHLRRDDVETHRWGEDRALRQAKGFRSPLPMASEPYALGVAPCKHHAPPLVMKTESTAPRPVSRCCGPHR